MPGFMDYLESAGGGALSGAALGPWGAVAGGAIGLISTAFGKKEPQYYNDPIENQRRSAANTMMTSHLGEQAAANSAGLVRRDALDAYENVKNNPNLQNNAAVQSSVYGNIMRGAERGIVSGNIAGAQADQQSYAQGANMLSGIQESNFQSKRYNDSLKQQYEQPNALQNIFGMGASYLAGKTTENIGGGNASSDVDQRFNNSYDRLKSLTSANYGSGGDFPQPGYYGNYPQNLYSPSHP